VILDRVLAATVTADVVDAAATAFFDGVLNNRLFDERRAFSFGCALVAGRTACPRPAAGIRLRTTDARVAW